MQDKNLTSEDFGGFTGYTTLFSLTTVCTEVFLCTGTLQYCFNEVGSCNNQPLYQFASHLNQITI